MPGDTSSSEIHDAHSLVSYSAYVPRHSGPADQPTRPNWPPATDDDHSLDYSIYDDDLDLECPTPRTETYWNCHLQKEVTESRYRYDCYTKRWVPVRCSRNGCPACGILKARRIAWAIWLAQPDYALTLTMVGLTREIAMRKINKFVGALREIYPTLKYTCQIEPNAGDTGNHAHLYIHVADRVLRKSVIERKWKHRIQLTRLWPNTTVRFFGYPMKCLADPDSRDAFLALNGVPKKQSLVYASPGFWRDGRGGPTMNREKASLLARKRRFRRPRT